MPNVYENREMIGLKNASMMESIMRLCALRFQVLKSA